jgi:FtsZ-interacting cell division protein ZipA
MSVMPSRSSTLAIAICVACFALAPTLAHAQWWRSAPKDFEDCADLAEKAKTKEDKTAQLADCNAKFAGRRKPGGGYTYYDFMQDRSFEIAGPNPTPDEQKKIDQEYTVYLEKERRSSIVAAFNAKQLQQQQKQQERQQPPRQLEQVSLRSEPEKAEKVHVPVASPIKPRAAASTEMRPRVRTSCAKGTFSCDWPRLSDGLNDLKKLFTPPSPPTKLAKRS